MEPLKIPTLNESPKREDKNISRATFLFCPALTFVNLQDNFIIEWFVDQSIGWGQ
ncbi:MAG: hypothetical protein WCS96_12700 [Victivallales bacterium]|jgi:hypothetical protein